MKNWLNSKAVSDLTAFHRVEENKQQTQGSTLVIPLITGKIVQ